MNHRTRRARYSWQVFGLAGSRHDLAHLMAVASRPASVGQCWWRRSFLHTAAGQSRTFTGFPLAPHLEPACGTRCQPRNL